MEQSFKDKVLNNKYKELIQALVTFDKSLSLDLDKFEDEIELDTLKNGQIQKFEYSVELVWKFFKSYLQKEKGISAEGPKDVLRQFGKFSYFTLDEISIFLEMIDSRNKIAHEYKDYIMEIIYPKIFGYQNLLNKIVKLNWG